MNTETQPQPSVAKLVLAWAISLLTLFIVFYVVSRAWKKGQTA